ncbi:EamA-like transporter family protein [Clostridium acetireducens DSM 10703]|jgi:drug/metabolite transporter (DMT)-like permease|uniref:EamA-like transporter family protein n=1 Tax=Clostridium acetireducens DSM 10703 TaxID=1121290 RepID=A0A1E8EVC4_9CLOT|nr:DMT family transporter [Clostridium acetireducens]OFH99454.1 EamA-like transporter family protein [Clostridium acetireducens DSM 10703]
MKKGYIYAIISAILFGSAGIFVKLAYKSGLDSISLLIMQYAVAVTIMFLIILIQNKEMLKVTKKQIFSLVVLGLVGNTFMTISYYTAFEYLPVAVVTMLLYTYPIMVFIYTVLFKKGKVNKKRVVALILAFIGAILTLNVLSESIRYPIKGIIIGLLCAVFYAFMNVYAEEKLININPLTVNAYSTLFSLITLIIYKSPLFIFKTHLSLESLFYIFILAIFCEIIPLTLLYAAINKIGALKVSIIGNLEIPTAMITSIIFLKESVTIMQIIGAFLVIGGVYLIKK